MFISLEGPEGSGKSSQLPLLAEYIESLGYSVVRTREPGGTKIGDQIREVLVRMDNENLHPRSEILLFLAARAQLVEELIKPSLAEGKVILCDRFGDSTLAYQGYGHGLDLDKLRTMLQFATNGLKPDLTGIVWMLMRLHFTNGFAKAIINWLRKIRNVGGLWMPLNRQTWCKISLEPWCGMPFCTM